MQTEDNWESFGEEEDDDDDVLIEVDIPELPDAVYDPQPDDAPGIIRLSLTVKAATLIFISGSGSAISSAKQAKSGSIYSLVKNY